jgi:hypothetical protein
MGSTKVETLLKRKLSEVLADRRFKFLNARGNDAEV